MKVWMTCELAPRNKVTGEKAMMLFFSQGKAFVPKPRASVFLSCYMRVLPFFTLLLPSYLIRNPPASCFWIQGYQSSLGFYVRVSPFSTQSLPSDSILNHTASSRALHHITTTSPPPHLTTLLRQGHHTTSLPHH